ncbi:hypothetical protein G9C98_005946 [Cotesia typhae]|uniref:Lipocalin/cytosolic fatty-acid binding domain-containing protein n=1 Tax=Cotesia typhae TaxID=2053667 RepID=A0A8J5QZA1_9HYME|nr:hypothetical protein G9C98_005946 [Cotesia typhae]
MLGLFYFSVLFISGTFAQIARLGPCPSVQPVQNFQPQNITGTWYEVRRYNNLYELNHVCTRLNVTTGPGNTLTLTTRSINDLSGAVSDWSVTGTPIGNISVPQYRVNVSDQAIANNSVVTILDTDYTGFTMVYMCRQVNDIQTGARQHWDGVGLVDPNNPASMVVQLPPLAQVEMANYNIVDTDYRNYLVAVQCVTRGLSPPNGWLLSRRRDLDQRYISRGEQILRENGVSMLTLITNDQRNCQN